MLASMFRFSDSELGTTLSGFLGVWLAVFGDGVLSTAIAILLVLNLLAGLVHCFTCLESGLNTIRGIPVRPCDRRSGEIVGANVTHDFFGLKSLPNFGEPDSIWLSQEEWVGV
jgi:hypothetical protein